MVCSLKTIIPETHPRNPNEIDPDHRLRQDDPGNDNYDQLHSSPPNPPDQPEVPDDDNNGNKFEFYHALNPSQKALQKNVTAKRDVTEHIVTWSCQDNINPESVEAKKLEAVGRGRETGTGDIVRNLKIGDVITVWAKARYAQWVHHVEEVKIEVYWAV